MNRKLRVALLALAIVVLATVGVMAGCSSSTSTPPATGGSSAPAAGSPGAAGTAVSIANFAFSPASLTVKVGDSVTWKNDDSTAHTVAFAAFDSGSIAPGASYSHKFDSAGTFDYKCSIHPSMTGTVIVQ